MKCLCGYEQVVLHEDEDKIIGSEPFILLDTNPYIRVGWPDQRQVKSYACPKCGTVRVDI